MPILNLINLKNRNCLITGATGNLGSVISMTLAELGANLILLDQKNAPFDLLISKLEKSNFNRYQVYDCNLEIYEERERFINSINKRYTSLSIMVNNAAFVGDAQLTGWAVPFEEQSIETWNRALEVNLTSNFHLIQGLNKLMKTSVGASIINITSIYGEHAPDWDLYKDTDMSNPAAYSISKGGLMQLTRWLTTTLAPEIRINNISPGGIFRSQPNIFIERYCKKVPLGRMAVEEDVIGAIIFLATDLSKYVTGQTIQVNGGWGLK